MMNRNVLAAAALVLTLMSSGSVALQAVGSQSGAVARTASIPAVAQQKAVIDQYCVTCHNQRTKTAGLALDTLDLNNLAEHAEIWEKAIVKLRGQLMPPPNARQPGQAAVDSLVSFLETTLDRAAEANPNPGSVTIHRLNRAEYEASVKDLFDIEINAADLLPADDISDGFDNIANVLKVSPSFLDQYINAARAVTLQAVGTPRKEEASRVTLRVGSNEQDGHVPGGVPLGLSGTVIEHQFPADGEYEIRNNAGGVLTLDGARITPNSRVAVKAGVHKLGIGNPPRSYIESEVLLQSFVPGAAGGFAGAGGGRGGRGGGGGGIEIIGPFTPTGDVLDSPSRRRIFVCHPANEAQEIPCATEIFKNVARRAFRRPITEADLAAPLEFFKEGRTADGNFESGIQTGLTAILASPKFLYRVEPPPPGLSGKNYKLNDVELASRLSFFLWSSIPDETLMDLAVKKKLSDPLVLEQQVKRMLADPRASSLVANFAFQWLRVRDLDKIDPDAVLFPNFDANLKTAFRREMELFASSIFREDRSVLDFMNADYTFLNERLAAHYGVPDVRGAWFRRVTLRDPNRWGLLGKGSILLVTSYPNRTSIVLRGAFILETITGTPPAAPPPGVEAFKENKEGERPKTVRDIMQAHRANPTCNSCHGILDPLGFALENFDAVGEWRTKDRWAGSPIDSSGTLANGTSIQGPDDLRKALMTRPDQFVQTVTEKLMTYGLGRSVQYYDMPTIRKIVRDTAKDNYRFSSIVLGIVKSAPFQTQRAPEGEKVAKVQ